MPPTPKRIRIKVDITNAQAVDFINKLALSETSDEGSEFRASFVSNPAAMLSFYGIDASPELFPATIELPTSQAMQTLQGTAAGAPVTVAGTAGSLFPIFCMIFPHIALKDS